MRDSKIEGKEIGITIHLSEIGVQEESRRGREASRPGLGIGNNSREKTETKGRDLEVERLLIDLRDKDANTRNRVVSALGEIKVSTSKVISGLLIALKDKDWEVRKSTADALVKVGTPEVVNGLLTILKDENEGVRGSAAEVLGKMKANTPEVVTGLLTVLKDKEWHVRNSAADALDSIKRARRK